MDFKSTLNLPDQTFGIPMKADLAIREPELLAKWNADKLYHQLQDDRTSAPTFVLHDGPPYTNSPIHLGTAMNKLLKDFVIKSKAIQGFRTPYVPGYDNHGLPIEQAVQKKLHEQKIKADLPTLRKACREHAQQYIDIQTEQFSRLGIFGLWELPYRTMEYGFEAEIVRVFSRLVEKGQIYRGLKPVMWSPTSRTALADTEIVYEEHTSKSIYVAFPLALDKSGWSEGLSNVFAVIWTTTPWTIPANLGTAFHPHLTYVAVKVGERTYILQKDRMEPVLAAIGVAEFEVVKEIPGSAFEYSEFQHPIFERTSLGVLAEYVTTEDGTGIVHTAPGHGREDFMTGQKYGLPVLCPVDEFGNLTEEAGEFAGVNYKDCDSVVVDRLQQTGNLLMVSDYVHQYPHAERDGKPVIFRATEQWFVSIDGHGLRDQMLREIEKIQWVPSSGHTRIKAMISGRPDWCISRQRPWGVGIPVFYGAESGVPVLDPVAIECVAKCVEKGGSDAWYVATPAEILPAGYKHPETGETEFRKETDVFDVWFDSGSTSFVVLEGKVHPEWTSEVPVDIYLEGSDQHRGWFNVSLILSTALRGCAPYKTVVTHGFVNDEQGRKMSKRLGNVIDPVDVCGKLGADVLRYWLASVDYADDVPCSEKILATAGEGYRKIRNTMRFMLSNLKGFDPVADRVPMLALDQWIVDQADLLVVEVLANYNRFDFRQALTKIYNFCNDRLSAFYLDAIKDRMYCDLESWDSRKSAQMACFEVIQKMTLLIAPILPFTAEEVYQKLPGERRKSSVHLDWITPKTDEEVAQVSNGATSALFAKLLGLRSYVYIQFEKYKAENNGVDSQATCAKISMTAQDLAILKTLEPSDLANLLRLSWVELVDGEPNVNFFPTPYPRCERSKLYRPDVELVNEHYLTARDRKAVGW